MDEKKQPRGKGKKSEAKMELLESERETMGKKVVRAEEWKDYLAERSARLLGASSHNCRGLLVYFCHRRFGIFPISLSAMTISGLAAARKESTRKFEPLLVGVAWSSI